MEFKKISKKDAKIKGTIEGLAGAGKSKGMVELLGGLISDKSKIGYVQTETGRLSFYSDLVGDSLVMDVAPPFAMGKLIEIIESAEKAGLKALGIDSISDFYSGLGGCLDAHAAVADVTKNSFSAWKKISPQWEAMMNKILSSPLHIVCTVKKKADYVIESSNGKQSVKKVGLAPVIKDGSEYRFVFQLDVDRETHKATASKDMTGLFDGKEPFYITNETGLAIRNWCLET